MNPLNTIIDADKILEVQNRQYEDKMLIEGSIDPNNQELLKTNVTNLGHFYCNYITGKFSTLEGRDGKVDFGVSYLRGKLTDGSTQIPLFTDYIPLDLLFSPGRVRNENAVNNIDTAPPGNALFYPFPLYHIFTVNSDILLDVKNDSNETNYLSLCFHGIRILSDKIGTKAPRGSKYLTNARRR